MEHASPPQWIISDVFLNKRASSMREIPPVTSTDLLSRNQEELRDVQNRRFRHQIALSFRTHPYYQELFRRLKLIPKDFQTLEDVQKLPVTTKKDYLSDPERSEEHTSELQSRLHLVCRLLLEKKKTNRHL